MFSRILLTVAAVSTCLPWQRCDDCVSRPAVSACTGNSALIANRNTPRNQRNRVGVAGKTVRVPSQIRLRRRKVRPERVCFFISYPLDLGSRFTPPTRPDRPICNYVLESSVLGSQIAQTSPASSTRQRERRRWRSRVYW